MPLEKPIADSVLTCLNEMFRARKIQNPSFSLRAYARLLHISPGQLSQLFSKKRLLTEETAHQIWKRSKLTAEERKTLASVFTQRFSVPIEEETSQFTQLSKRQFDLFFRWYFYPILNLCKTMNGKLSAKVISKELEIPEKEARTALHLLEKEGLLIKKGLLYKRSVSQLTTTHGIPDSIIRRSHKEVLERAISSLGRDAIEKNDFTNMTMAIDPAKLPKAKKMITAFRRKLCLYLESGESKTVYTLSIQLFPASKIQGEKI